MATPRRHCKEIKLHRGQLDLDSPLLSTRRSSTSVDPAESSVRELSAQSTMVPFSWESSPGVPKDAAAAADTDRTTTPPPPNPPPARWRRQRPSIEIHYRDRCNAKDDGDDDDDDDVFSDAVERVSLSENLNIAACRLSSFDGTATKDVEETVSGSRPRPSFIMERFLPAANAIANSLALNNQQNRGCTRRADHHHHSSCTQCARKELAMQRIMHQRRKRRSNVESKPQQPPFFSHLEDESELSTRACGVMLFFPWSLRPVACGFKSPTRSTAPSSGPNNNVGSLFTPRFMRGVGNESHLDINDEGTNSGSFDVDKRSSVNRECNSPGWGLSFLDWRRKGMRCVVEREREKGSEKSRKGRKDVPKCKEGNWSMPRLKTPSEPWLSHALNSINKRN